jgi:hypothetical protein
MAQRGHALARRGQEVVEVDCFGPFDVADPAHLVLLCSDGLYRAVPDDSIWQLLLSARDAEMAVAELARLAWRNQSDDNISAAVTEIGEFFRSRPAAPAPRRREAALAPLPILIAAPPPAAEQPAPSAASPIARRPRPQSRLRLRLSRMLRDDTLFAVLVSIGFCWLILSLLI